MSRSASINFAFLSTMTTVPWGGSETLWHGAARHLLARGFAVHTRTAPWQPTPAPLVDLARTGAQVSFEETHATGLRRLQRLVAPRAYAAKWARRRRDWLAAIESPRVVVSCGSIADEIHELDQLADAAIPYAVIVQAAAPEIWPTDAALDRIGRFLGAARRVYFVSRHNRDDVQQCLGQTLPHAEVISNPANLSPELRAAGPLAFPSGDGLRLACVARLNVAAKGQDLLLRTLSLDRWKDRDVSLTLYGSGPHRRVLENAARYLGVGCVSFAGPVDDLAAIWRENHLGVLASRYEGLPLSLIEAMMLGRTNVVTRICGNPEIVEDSVTGFIAAAPTVESFDEALERAWQRRGELGAMGAAAARRIRQLVPEDPCRDLADRLVELFR